MPSKEKTMAQEPQTINYRTGCETTETCPEHGPYKATVLGVIGDREIKSLCPVCESQRERKHKQEQEDRHNREKAHMVERFLSGSGVPLRFQGKGFDAYKAKAISQQKARNRAMRYAEKFNEGIKTGTSMIFCGKPGTGKTHLSCAIVEYIIHHHGRPASYTTAFHMIQKVKESYSKKTEKSEREVIESYRRPDFLVIDEVGVQHGTESDLLILYQVINSRYERCRPMLLISNFPEDELVEYVGVRCIDRLREGGGVVVPFDWESYRK